MIALLAMLLSMTGVEGFAHAFEVANQDGVPIYYIIRKDGNGVAVSYRGDSETSYSNEYTGHVVIPKSVTYDGVTYPVTAIAYRAFYQCYTLTGVTIPNSISIIDASSFSGCSSLASVTIPNSVTMIGGSAFAECRKLTSVTFEDGEQELTFDTDPDYWMVFYSCPIESLYLGRNVKYNIKGVNYYSPFENNSYLEKLTIGATVTSIQPEQFWRCTSLSSVSLPNSVTDIGESAFSACTKLTDVTIGSSVTSIGNSAFINCKLTAVNLPASLTTIGSSAFYGCMLTEISIPGSVTSIGNYAFVNNPLVSISLNCPQVGGWQNTETLKEVKLGGGVKDIERGAFSGCKALSTVTLSEGLMTIGDNAFQNCALTQLTIPTTVTTIGIYAFQNCQLTQLTIPASVTSIGNYAFENNPLKSVTMNCPQVGRWFQSMKTLEEVKLGSGVRDIENQAFSYCTALSTVSLSEGLKTIGDNAFQDCALTQLTIPATVTKIGDYAFSDNQLQRVVVPDQVETIGNSAFNMPTLKSIVIGVRVKSVGSHYKAIPKVIWIPNTPPEGYKNFRGLVNYVANEQYQFNNYDTYDYNTGNPYKGTIVYPLLSSWFELGGMVYAPTSAAMKGTCEVIDCTYEPGEKQVDFGKTFTYNRREMTTKAIQPYACYGNTYLNTVSIGSNIPVVGDCAFNGCTGLTSISIPAAVDSVGYGAFRNCSSLTVVSMDNGDQQLKLGGYVLKDSPLDSVFIGRNISYSPVDPMNRNKATSPFYDNATLRSVVINDRETEILDNEFYGCANLQNIYIGNNVTTFGKWAFSRCFKLGYLEFGRNVKTIGEEAFSDCSLVSTIISHATVPPVCGNQALADINPFTCRLLVPTGCTEPYSKAPQWEQFLAEENASDVPVISATLSQASITLTEGNDTRLQVELLPTTAADKTVTWSSSDTSIATVTADGTVKAVKAGTAVITCTSTVNPAVSATCTVTVEKPFIAVTGLEVQPTKLTIVESTSYKGLTVKVLPDDATDKSVTWKTADTTIATLDKLTLTAVKAGTTAVVCTSRSNSAVSKSIDIEVTAAAVTVSKETLTLTEGEEEALTCRVTPAEVSTQKVTWETSDATVATVDADGKVRAVKAGTATITCRWTWNPERQATCTVTVKAPVVPVSRVTLSQEALRLTEGDTLKLAVTIEPADATYPTVRWESSDTTVVKVDSIGTLVALQPGWATVSCKWTQDETVKGECEVTVLKQFVPPVPAPLSTSARAEYFIDRDPGYGLGRGIAVADYDSLSYELDLGGLKPGAHILYIRCSDEYGRWSPTVARPLYVQPYQGFVALEYYYDMADPGQGLARALPRPESNDCELTASLPTRGLSLGTHLLNVRGLRPNGTWCNVETRQFLVVERPAEPGNLEYFFDRDPGYGRGQTVDVMTGVSQVAIDLGGLAPGAHILYMRNRDEQGRWSPTVSRPLYVCPVVDVVQLEYFYDSADPGEGRAVQVPLPADKLSEFTFEADASQLAVGDHHLNVRARDLKGRWTLVSSEPFTVTKTDTGVQILSTDFAFAVSAASGQCRLTPVGANSRNDCLVEVVDVAGLTLAKANWPAEVPELSLPVAAGKGAVLIVRVSDVTNGRQLLRRILMK